METNSGLAPFLVFLAGVFIGAFVGGFFVWYYQKYRPRSRDRYRDIYEPRIVRESHTHVRHTDWDNSVSFRSRRHWWDFLFRRNRYDRSDSGIRARARTIHPVEDRSSRLRRMRRAGYLSQRPSVIEWLRGLFRKNERRR